MRNYIWDHKAVLYQLLKINMKKPSNLVELSGRELQGTFSGYCFGFGAGFSDAVTLRLPHALRTASEKPAPKPAAKHSLGKPGRFA